MGRRGRRRKRVGEEKRDEEKEGEGCACVCRGGMTGNILVEYSRFYQSILFQNVYMNPIVLVSRFEYSFQTYVCDKLITQALVNPHFLK